MRTDIYSALSGAQAAWRQVEVISNNLANTATTGFRAQHVAFSLDGAQAKLGAVTPDMRDAALVHDGNATHLAVRGPAFFALADGSFTRDGAFHLDGEGALVTAQGTGVLSDSGAVQLEPGETFTVTSDGTILGETSGEVGRLRVVGLDGAAPLGGNRWSGVGVSTPEGVSVVQGALEGSNADPMQGMVQLIEASRFFEVQQKAMQTSDEMRGRINRIGGS